MNIHPYYYSWQKRAFDVSTATLLLLLIFPFGLLISLVIYASSGHPVFFTQRRFGKDKKIFTIYKFRTMHNNAEKLRSRYEKYNEAPAPMFKIESDPRFTGLGKWLSNYGIDELPQLLNILKNEMSIVGPRPLPIAEADKLDANWDFRYLVKPGILSDWALSSQRHSSLRAWRKLEEHQLLSGSIFTDIKLILLIITSLLQKAVVTFHKRITIGFPQ